MFYLMVVALLVAVAIAVAPAAQALRMKLVTYFEGFFFMATANDLPAAFRGSNCLQVQVNSKSGSKRVIRLVFIRHGQSVWNSLFNSFDATWPVRAVKAMVNEAVYFFTNPFDSVIVDSPLSEKGRSEAQELARFVRSAKGQVCFDASCSLIVCSNLRRAMETALVGMQPRIVSTGERIVVDSSLQEGSRNIDAQSLSTEPGKIVPCKMGELATPQLLGTAFDPHLNGGNRTAKRNVYDRMDEFVQHLFGGVKSNPYVPASGAESGNSALKEVIVVGHSGYFRCFFKRFLPSSSRHVAKTKKLKNCAVVSFDLVRNESTGEVYIEESTVSVLYKGF
ncbi:Histidine phosphatase superfamily (branch 1), putative [Trypanosoma equiperdum]|uniref:Uncharacterized protein n=2 Tax=Trypanozoon TaxID=39700 RepID=Q38E26_TRYB2|nr:hypothetical protein, conserved [Trypanosoma brucei brucei TREU927]EAN76944.1 hypothetical protein, conserved [Trypanosoma brucei brucei TREU927]SCU72472.1 Histidine phosphatase superfamily (branch 1), putative [Trypanosoma equiperdum]